jgi:hypothetical protein
MLDCFIEALADVGNGVCGAPLEGMYFEEYLLKNAKFLQQLED